MCLVTFHQCWQALSLDLCESANRLRVMPWRNSWSHRRWRWWKLGSWKHRSSTGSWTTTTTMPVSRARCHLVLTIVQTVIPPMNSILSSKSVELGVYALSLSSITVFKHLFSIPSLIVLCDMWLRHAFACLMGMSAQVRGIIYWTAHTGIMCTVWKISLRLIVAAGISGFVRLLQQETWQWDSVPSCIMLLSIFSKFGIYR